MFGIAGNLLTQPHDLAELTTKITICEEDSLKKMIDIQHDIGPHAHTSIVNDDIAEVTLETLHTAELQIPNPDNKLPLQKTQYDTGIGLFSKDSQLSSSTDSLEDDSQGLDRLSRERDTFTDSHRETPNGSMTSASLSFPLPPPRSTSPGTQMNDNLGPEVTTKSQSADGGPDYCNSRPRSSIPSRLSASTYAQQCVAAAHASRLNPYALHKGEQALLQDDLCHLHVTVYLNIRNGILRLWTRNPMVSVTREEALGCAKDFRWMNLASFAYDWLVRNAYINFGCVHIPRAPIAPKKGRRKDGPTVVIIGAGMAGLGCARQLQGLFDQYPDTTTPPKVILLEGRKRIGGRVYSHPLESLQSSQLSPGLRPTAEMGAQIIVGFDHGNPLDPIIRAQLALRYHLLRDISTIYDIDGTPVDELRDAMVEKLYNDILDRSGAYRHKPVVTPVAEGDRELIDSGRDSSADDGLTIRQYEEAAASGTIGMLLPSKRVRRGVSHKTANVRTSAGFPLSDLGATNNHSAAIACQAMGWKLRNGVTSRDSISLDRIASKSKTQSLGTVMDDGIRQYQKLLPLGPKDMRLLNWHFANLEYANAANVGKLSLSGWDQDMGNEFEGEHAQVVGGYQQVPRGLWSFPDKLDVRTNKTVTKISYDPRGSSSNKTSVHCENGEIIQADKIVITAPLGVLKKGSIKFEPPLPEWKTGPVNRLGFGTMNKVILVFEKPFWDCERDMFGLLREPTTKNSLSQSDYSQNRGRFYLFWNCIKTAGLPVLIALMAGDAAHQAERMTDSEILSEVTSQLRNIFKHIAVPDPLETIITRWGQDKFANGSYSYVGTEALPGDYDLMAKPIGNLYFAGEATCGTHPATVHGAYLSGIRAASEILESIIGPITFHKPLVPTRSKAANTMSIATVNGTIHNRTPANRRKRKAPLTTETQKSPGKTAATPRSNNSFPSASSLREAYDKAMWEAIIGELGPAEPRPAKKPLNPFLLYQKDYWHICKTKCDDARRASTGNINAKAPRDEIRQALGQMWRDAPENIRQPYLDQIAVHRFENDESLEKWKERIIEWERKTYEVKDRWCAANPFDAFKIEATKKYLESIEG
ncbi:amine oxidase/SWIRM domain-containing protein [Histoplasma capsulatum G186AR]|uniref:Amine oxidase/SWIRM domain-containing protein n=1 Tax=Ajellomyces capsulatus TaxID=5037 RepID=A0A8H8D8E2_AJECA|nr:amine oxidase/SWIRM domain-containing protein [Histoplasma capsulatum]QSS70175.1 amine oxidase/SWIRM domain-containing protein [Histoplasma capsulatum G186AR]